MQIHIVCIDKYELLVMNFGRASQSISVEYSKNSQFMYLSRAIISLKTHIIIVVDIPSSKNQNAPIRYSLQLI